MQKRCHRCNYSMKTCFCNEIKPIDSNIKFIILIHPKEAFKEKTGTGRLTHLFLKESEIIKGTDFTNNKRVNELINDEKYYPVILYPSKNNIYIEETDFREKLSGKQMLIFIIDGTWWDVNSIIRESKNLHNLPNISFKEKHISKFHFKKQPEKHFLSTIESVYYLLLKLKESNIANPDCEYENMMSAFLKMVNNQRSFWNKEDKNI